MKITLVANTKALRAGWMPVLVCSSSTWNSYIQVFSCMYCMTS